MRINSSYYTPARHERCGFRTAATFPSRPRPASSLALSRVNICSIVAGAAALCVLFADVCSGALPRSVSTSRQFIVFGNDAGLRGAVCELAERTKTSALSLLAERDRWFSPIVISVQLPQANLPELPAANLVVSQTGSGLKIQLDLVIGADVSAGAVEHELLRAIYLEIMYRAESQTPAGTAYVEPPEWLVEGTLALSEGGDSSVQSDTLSSGILVPLPTFLAQRRALLDSPSRALFRAYSAAFISMLIDEPDGRVRLARFLADLPRSGNDSAADLRAHFPGLGVDAEKMEERWKAHLARLSTTQRYALLSCEETERKLAELLHVRVPGDSQSSDYSLEEFPRFAHLASAAEALRDLTRELLALSGRANPIYRPIVAEYAQISTAIARGKTRRVPQKLIELRSLREQASRQIGAISDYLNWFEATQQRSASGAFADYMKAAESALDRRSRRRDAISVYLDSVESQY